ncbi:dihydrofolate reductase [Streptococcus phocae subsp. phocae]|uniref:Dihydrofolate reductase n=1 Tax=Streptococcus phocae TaxID=119224 RepID=A0A0P6SF39_9STRE|nr:dihydrofolate reductase [Streptococcus phocae]KPJ22930.1 dihydrofolate reductase [Streptococcus phocae]
MTKEIVAIWAEDESGVIGVDGRLPWHLPKELQHFKQTTLNQAILMGRVTFDGMKRRLLPNRQTLVLTRDKHYHVDGALTMASVEQVLEWYHTQEKTLYIIGGNKVLEAFDGYFNKIIKTVVHHRFDGDTYRPRLDLHRFVTAEEVFYPKDEKNPYDFTVTVLKHH